MKHHRPVVLVAEVDMSDWAKPQFTTTPREAVYWTTGFAVFARYEHADIEWLIGKIDGPIVDKVALDKAEAIRRADEWQAALDAGDESP